MVNENSHTPVQPTHIHEQHHCAIHPFKRVSWTAIFVGALVGLGLGFLLNLFGIALGLSAFTLNEGGNVLAIGGFIGILIGIIVSMMLAGYAAGYLGRLYCPDRNLGILYGFLTWSVALILSAILAGHLGHYVDAYTVSISNQPSASTRPHTDNTTTTTQIKSKENSPSVSLNATSEHLAWTAFIIFALFTIGAISTCLGACWGMGCCKKEP